MSYSPRDAQPAGRPAPWVAARSTMRLQILNTRWAVISVLAALVVLPGAMAWHHFQIHRNARLILAQAKQNATQERFRKAADLCFHYLKLKPDDAAGWVLLARSFDKAAVTRAEKQRSLELYFQTIALASDQTDLRRRLAELLYEMQWFSIAEYQADQLLKVLPQDPGGWRIKSQSSYEQAKRSGRISMNEVSKSYTQAVKQNPQDVELSTQLATIYRRELQVLSPEEREQLADEVMNRLVQGHAKHVPALLARYRYRQQYQIPGADPDLDKAISLAPDDFDVLLAAGQRATRRGKHTDAVQLFERAIQKRPNDREAYLGLGVALTAADQPRQAVEAWKRGLQALGKNDLSLNLRLAETLIVLGRLREAEQVLAVCDDEIAVLGRRLPQSSKMQLQVAVDFVRAKWHAARGNYRSAVPVFRRVLAARASENDTSAESAGLIDVYYQLAAAYLGNRQPDLAAGIYEEVARLDPLTYRHHLAAAEAWETAGLWEAAANQYRLALVDDQAPMSTWILRARVELARQRNLPEAQRNWYEFEQVLTKAHEVQAGNSLLIILEADYQFALGKTDEALAVLQRAVSEQPAGGSQPSPAAERLEQALVMAYEKWGRPSEADRALENFTSRTGNGRSAAMLRMALLCHRRQFSAAGELLDSLVARATPAERPSLEFQRAQVDLQSGDIDAGLLRLQRLAENAPDNLALWQLRADVASEAEDWSQVEQCEQRLQALEGEEGTLWRYYRGRRLLALSVDRLDEGYLEADSLQSTLLAMRPSWAQGYTLKGLVCERRGEVETAIEAYQTAIQLGYENLLPYYRLISLLEKQGRVAEADRYLQRLLDLASASPEISTLAISVSSQYGQLGRAVRLAEEGAARRPNDPEAHWWLGQTLMLAGRANEALASLEQARRLKPDDPRMWTTLFGYYRSQQQVTLARRLLDEFSLAGAFAEKDKSFILAQCFELLRDFERADLHYRNAVKAGQGDRTILQRAAAFFIDRDAVLAEDILRQAVALTAPGEGADAARRELALHLIRADGPKNWHEIHRLSTDLHADAPTAPPENLRVVARLLLAEGGVPQHQQALRLLERLVRNERDVRPEDRLLLARLYLEVDRVSKAREELRVLVSRPHADAGHVAAFIEFLLDNNYVSEASSYLHQLEQSDPESFTALSLRSRWLALQARHAEVEPLVEPFLEKRLASLTGSSQRVPVLRQAAELYAQVGIGTAAERYYRLWTAADPSAFAAHAEWLARVGRMEEAIDLCLAAGAKDDTSRPAVALCRVLLQGTVAADLWDRCEPLWQTAGERFGDQPDVLLGLGNVRYLQGRMADAIAFYRQAMAHSPGNATIQNNLALALAEDPAQREEAERQIQAAIEGLGPQDELQDTLGVILLRDGRAEEAATILRELATLTRVPATVHFHLAEALIALGSAREARAAFERAIALGIKRQPLAPSEQQTLERLETSLLK